MADSVSVTVTVTGRAPIPKRAADRCRWLVTATEHPPADSERQWARHLGRAGFAIVGCIVFETSNCVRVGEALLFGTSSGPDNSRTGHSRAGHWEKVRLEVGVPLP